MKDLNLFSQEAENNAQNPLPKAENTPKNTKVVCLGHTFENEAERRAFFREELRKKLPELKNIEGFPIGEDEDIITLSDPPYYTACPNPWLNDFIAQWEAEKSLIPNREAEFFVQEPYASDVSEGKNNPIYTAHTYHTKVPHPAIMRYILHYTQPGDIVLDGFSGTGMTGVAAQICENPDRELKLKIENEWKTLFNKLPKWGHRKSILNDLSPIASSISYNCNSKFDVNNFIKETEAIIEKIEQEVGWVYEVEHEKGKKGKINYVIWSDVFICPSCGNDIVFWNETINLKEDTQKMIFECPNCNKELKKDDLSKKFETVYDPISESVLKQVTTIPVMINYSFDKKRYQRTPSQEDLDLLEKIHSFDNKLYNKVPKYDIPKGDKTGEPIRIGYTKSYHLHTLRNIYVLNCVLSKISFSNRMGLWFTSVLLNSSKLYRWRINGKGGYLNGTLYVASLTQENNVIRLLKDKIKDLKFEMNNFNAVQTGSMSSLALENNSIDYIFTDPPFGANLMYSELNFLTESWIKVFTNNKKEAIENKTQNKNSLDYQEIMAQCFLEYYRVLKPNKWMTVEFSNTSAAVWNSIQTALQKAGFIIANVAALDKQQGSFNAVSNSTSVKQDLAISCYKPSSDFEHIFETSQGEVAVWDFVREHLHHLPVHFKKANSTTAIIERSPKILYDRLITFYLMRGLPVPIDAREFQQGLQQKYVERDGMYFTTEQAAEYDEKKALTPDFQQLSLVVSSESDAIEWLKERLRKQPQKYNEIMPDFRIAAQSLRRGEVLPELQDILNESFIQSENGTWRVPNVHEAADREVLRNRTLLREFQAYVEEMKKPKAKKLKEVRVEALRAGFKACWKEQNFGLIVELGEKIPQNILLEDEQLLMYYDIAKDRV